MGVMAAAAAVAAAAVVWYYACALYHRLRGAPPLVSGIVPVLGCIPAMAFEKPLPFLERRRAALGDAFTLLAGGRLMTFLFDPRDFPAFFSASSGDVSFGEATLPFLDRGFGVTPASYFRNHHAVLGRTRMHLAPKNLAAQYCAQVSRELTARLGERWGGDEGEAPLEASVRGAVFWSSVAHFFAPDAAERFPRLEENLKAFDDLFEVACSPLPQFLLRGFTRAKVALRGDLSALMSGGGGGGARDSGLAAEVMRAYHEHAEPEDRSDAGWLLSVLWASQANSIPASFWTLCHLLQHPALLARARAEVDAAAAEAAAAGTAPGSFTYAQFFSSLRFVQKCVRESVRLRAPGTIVRKAMRPVRLASGLVVPAGHMLCLSPRLYHRTAAVFERPDEFVPDRWGDDLRLRGGGAGASVKHSFLAFGAGAYRCPGMFFADMEISLVVATALRDYDLELAAPAPEPRVDRLVGLQAPVRDVPIRYRRRRRRRR